MLLLATAKNQQSTNIVLKISTLKMTLSIFIFILCFTGLTVGNVQEIINIPKVTFIADLKMLCLELKINNIPLKEDFYNTDYRLKATHYTSENQYEKARASIISSEQSSCHAQVIYDIETDAHYLHACGRVTSNVVDVIAVTGAIKMANHNNIHNLVLKRGTSLVGSIAGVSQREETLHSAPCDNSMCKDCIHTCKAMHNDLNEGLCDSKIVQFLEQDKLMQPLSVINFLNSNVTCMHFKTRLRGPCEFFPIAYINDRELESVCNATTPDDTSDGHWCTINPRINNDEVKLKKLYIVCNSQKLKVPMERTMSLTSFPNEVHNDPFPNDSKGQLCSLLINNHTVVQRTVKKKNRTGTHFKSHRNVSHIDNRTFNHRTNSSNG